MKHYVKPLVYYFVSLYYYVREKIQPSKIKSDKEIPILINNFNRLSTLKTLIHRLTLRGYNNIYIIDNQSTYPPLLAYYNQCPHTVFRLNQNIGFQALWKSTLCARFCHDYYIYTDSDVVPANHCPADFIDYFFQELKKHPLARKIGFSLRIDNLPDSFGNKEKVIEWESQFYKKPPKDGLYRAPIDTTFALYRPRVGLSRSRFVEVYRTSYPYEAEHLPWYVDTNNLTEEEIYYIDHCTKVTAWSSQLKTN